MSNMTNLNKRFHHSGPTAPQALDFHGLDGDECLHMAEMMAETIGRKFEVIDVQGDDEFDAAAMQYTLNYSGSFDFMVQMKETLARQSYLSDGQVKGVLNCLRAEMIRNASATPARPAGPVTPTLRDGIYTVIIGDESYVTLRLRAASDRWDNLEAGTQVASWLSGSDNENSYTRFAFVKGSVPIIWKRYRDSDRLVEALTVLLQGDADAAGRRYAMESGNCYVCNRTLTTPESIERGIGPVCLEGGF